MIQICAYPAVARCFFVGSFIMADVVILPTL